MNQQRTTKSRKKKAPALPVQSANQVARLIGGPKAYQRQVAREVERACAVFGGQIVEVLL
jgi:hypothetical protein